MNQESCSVQYLTSSHNHGRLPPPPASSPYVGSMWCSHSILLEQSFPYLNKEGTGERGYGDK